MDRYKKHAANPGLARSGAGWCHTDARRRPVFKTKKAFLDNAETIYVKCFVSQGIFETEFYISVKDSSAYVDRANVQVEESADNGDQVNGKVIAYLVEEKNDEALIELPGVPVVAASRAWVPIADLASV